MDPVIIGETISAARMALQIYLLLLKQSGMSPEEATVWEAEERRKFQERTPDKLSKPWEDG